MSTSGGSSHVRVQYKFGGARPDPSAIDHPSVLSDGAAGANLQFEEPPVESASPPAEIASVDAGPPKRPSLLQRLSGAFSPRKSK